MLKFKKPAILNTVGDGYWSNRAAAVAVTHMNIAYLSDDNEFGELRVYFTPKSWSVNKDGLIYTDSQWENELTTLLNDLGYAGRDVSYSEQGMQGENYVSLDVGKKFINSWKKKHQVTV
jgi:hypothetical protein